MLRQVLSVLPQHSTVTQVYYHHGCGQRKQRNFMTFWDFTFFNALKEKWTENSSSQTTLPHRIFTIILNRPLPEITGAAVQASDVVLCVDGGANHFVDEIIKPSNDRLSIQNLRSFQNGKFLTLGDLDSLRPDTFQFLKNNKVPLIQDNDQDTTDLEKALARLSEITKSTEQPNDHAVNTASLSPPSTSLDKILIFGGFGGRIDHVLANLSATFKASARLEPTQSQMFLIGDGSLCCFLPRGCHELNLHSEFIGDQCALLPLMPVDQISTRGLKWNLDQHRMEFGGLISSSNRLSSRSVFVETSDAVLWYSDFQDRNLHTCESIKLDTSV